MAKRKSVGWYNDLTVWKNSGKIGSIFFENDSTLKILGNNITRTHIFNDLLKYFAESISRKITLENNMQRDVFTMLSILRSLTEIIAYPLSKKKISGLGAVTKATESKDFDDKVLKILIGINEKINDMVITKTHKEFNQFINKDIEDIRAFNQNALKKYIWSYKREERFLLICGQAIDQLQGCELSKAQLKQIIYEALKHFEKKGFVIYIKSIDRLFKKGFYELVHEESFLETGEDVSFYSVIKTSKKSVDTHPKR